MIRTAVGFMRGMQTLAKPWWVWLYSRLTLDHVVGDLRTWIWAVLIVDSVSLVIDSVDPIRYAAGDRDPSFRL